MKTIALLLLIAAPVLWAQEKAQPSHIATLSLQRIVNESTEGRAANQRLQALGTKMAADLSAKQKELQQAQPGAPGDSAQKQLQQLAQQSQTEFANAQRQVQNELRAKLAPVVAQVAGDRGVDVVLNADTAVVWTARSLDITADVLAKFNSTPPK